MNAKKKALGKGLGALLSNPETDITSQGISQSTVVGAISEIPVSQIEANPFQPRSRFEKEALQELADSIKKQGIIQPLTVRKLGYDKYQLISGERRLKAAIIAELDKVPVYIRVADDMQMLEMALVENIQREDLNPIEIGVSYQQLIEECKLTQEELSKRVGKNRTTITNYIRLLKLPADVQVALRDEKISMGHARAIINISEPEKQTEIVALIINKELSVRDVEMLVKNLHQVKPGNQKKEDTPQEIPEAFQNKLQKLKGKLHFPLKLKRNNKGKGQIVIPFSSDKELEQIFEILD